MITKANPEKICVVKLGALGDFIQALGPMKAIRAHHANAHITLITTNPFKSFGEKCGYFDATWIDSKPKLHQPAKWLTLRKKLISAQFDRVYDLQNNDRTELYFRLYPKSKRPEWVGAARGASHENSSPERIAGHAFEGHKMTLARAGIENIDIDTLDWLKQADNKFNLPSPYILFIPGSAPQHPQKRWPAENYAALATRLAQKKITSVLLGTNAEKEVTEKIAADAQHAIQLTGKTSLFDIAALAHNAYAAVGNDTGPMHMISATGCKTLTLFSSHSNPLRHAPKGLNAHVLQESNLKILDVEKVEKKLLEITA